MRKVVVLGATGSIGVQALEVIAGSDELAVAGLSADTGWEPLVEAAREHGVPRIALADADAAAAAKNAWSGEVLAGEEGIRELVATSEADLVLNGIVGFAGLGPTIVALTGGDRRRARQQGVTRRRRSPHHRARRGDRCADHPRGLRAFGALPARPR